MHVKVVPNCPKCGSSRTGQYLNLGPSPEREIVYARRKGELIRDWNGSRDRNLYCEDCGFEWAGIPEKLKLTKEDLIALKKNKGIEAHEKLPSKKKKRRKGIKVPGWVSFFGKALFTLTIGVITSPLKGLIKPKYEVEEESIWDGYDDIEEFERLTEEEKDME